MQTFLIALAEIRKVCMVDDILLHASDRKAFNRLFAESCFACLLRHTTATTATTAALLQPRQRDSHAESARCQDLQFVTSPVSKWWLRAPASRAGGSAAARHWPGTASASSLQPRPQPVPMDCWARGGAAARPHLSAATTVPQSMACMPKRGGRKPSERCEVARRQQTRRTTPLLG